MALDPFIPQMFTENLLTLCQTPPRHSTYLIYFHLSIATEVGTFPISQISKYEYKEEVC